MLFPNVTSTAARVLRDAGIDHEWFLDVHELKMEEFRLRGQSVGAYTSTITVERGETVTAFTEVATGETAVRAEFDSMLLDRKEGPAKLAEITIKIFNLPDTPEKLAEVTETWRRYCYDPDCVTQTLPDIVMLVEPEDD